jgi:hypothetical protein
MEGEKHTLAPESPRSNRVVFICDPSAEADRLQATLRSRGYPVVDVPLGLLGSRIRYEQPDVVVLDAEAPNAAELSAEIIQGSSEQAHVLLIGERREFLEELVQKFATNVQGFTRPVDVESIAQAIIALLGPPAQPGPRARIPRAPILMAASRRPVRVDSLASLPPDSDGRHHSEAPSALAPSFPPILPSERPSGPPPFRSRPAPSSGPSLERGAGLSAETRAILEQGKRKVRAGESPNPRAYRLGTSADEEVPEGSDLLLALTSPLEPEDDLGQPKPSATTFLDGPEPPFGYRAKTAPPDDSENVESGGEPTRDHGPRDDFEFEESTNPGGRVRPETQKGGTDDEVAADDEPPPSSLGPALVQLPEAPRAPIELLPSKIKSGESPVTVGSLRAKANQFTSNAGREPSFRTMATQIRNRVTGVLVQQGPGGLRRMMLSEGDVRQVPSTSEVDSLATFLERESRVTREVAQKLKSLPDASRAAAALVAWGALPHDELRSLLAEHAEWILVNIAKSDEPLTMESNPSGRALDEQDVFGGRAGAEVFVSVFRRAFDAQAAFDLLGRGQVAVAPGDFAELLSETGVGAEGTEFERVWTGADLVQLLRNSPDKLVLLAALAELGVMKTGLDPERESEERTLPREPRDAHKDTRAFEERLNARLRSVQSGSYFRLLGVDTSATQYEIDRARAAILDDFSIAKLLGSGTNRHADVQQVVAMVEEAHRVLSNDTRRERYRRALEKRTRRG